MNIDAATLEKAAMVLDPVAWQDDEAWVFHTVRRLQSLATAKEVCAALGVRFCPEERVLAVGKSNRSYIGMKTGGDNVKDTDAKTE
jgi:hypothetical protein